MISIFKPPVCPRFPSVEMLNQDVTPIAVHSHNDYWRKRPLVDALSLGCISVEADIWKFPKPYMVTDTYTKSTAKFEANELYVGHNQMHLEAERTLDKMYLEPLQAFLESSNKHFSFAKNPKKNGHDSVLIGEDFMHGVFYDDPEQTLDLWLDIKTDANGTYLFLQKQLQPLIEKGYLTSYTEDKGIERGPITVTLTGNVPWELIEAENTPTRHVFLDCPLYDLQQVSEETLAKYRKLCIYASTSYKREVQAHREPGTQSSMDMVKVAHSNGLKARIWGGPEWPRRLQADYWTKVLGDGYDLLNTDYIHGASEY